MGNDLKYTDEQGRTFTLTVSESELYDSIEVLPELVQLVVFRLQNEYYGFDIKKVVEVLRLKKVSYLPLAANYILGVINLRGNILPIVSLKSILDLQSDEEHGGNQVIVIESDGLKAGVLVDEVYGDEQVEVELIEPALSTLNNSNSGFISGEVNIDDKLVGLIKIEKILEYR